MIGSKKRVILRLNLWYWLFALPTLFFYALFQGWSILTVFTVLPKDPALHNLIVDPAYRSWNENGCGGTWKSRRTLLAFGE